MNYVLIVEDESIIALELEDIVLKLGFKNVKCVHTKQDALDFIQTHEIDLTLLDLNLNGGFEGIDIAQAIKKKQIATSIIFLTAYSDAMVLESISSIDFSAFVLKPFQDSELKAILKLQKIKINSSYTQGIYITKEYVIDLAKASLLYKEKEIKLTHKEFKFLLYLSKHHNIVSFEDIEKYVWDEKKVTTNTRRNLLYKLNKKLPVALIHVHKSLGYSIR